MLYIEISPPDIALKNHHRRVSARRRPPAPLREARRPLLRSDPRVKSAFGRQPRPAPWPDLNPAHRSPASPSSPPPFLNPPTSSPARRARPQSCRRRIVFKSPNQCAVNSQVARAEAFAPFLATPPCNFDSQVNQSIELARSARAGEREKEKGLRPRSADGEAIVWASSLPFRASRMTGRP